MDIAFVHHQPRRLPSSPEVHSGRSINSDIKSLGIKLEDNPVNGGERAPEMATNIIQSSGTSSGYA